ncbi:hypothetical protein D2W49_19050, partial [Burkholderia pseudomallei]
MRTTCVGVSHGCVSPRASAPRARRRRSRGSDVKTPRSDEWPIAASVRRGDARGGRRLGGQDEAAQAG